MSVVLEAAEKGWLPDLLIRYGIQRLNRQRLLEEARDSGARYAQWLSAMRQAPIALHTQAANEQHYEVPAAFYGLVLGPHRKYSGCLWDVGASSLAQAEERSLQVTCEHAGLRDGQRVLELGCGWGSLSLWMAARYPSSQIVSVSNSQSQRRHIEEQAAARGLANLRVLTCDMNDFQTEERFDRVVSVEMFEHMRNWNALFKRVGAMLNPGGKVFVHVFCHKRFAYEFAAEGDDNWMGRHFFTGGMMPSRDLFRDAQQVLDVENQWDQNGRHYARTARAWLENLDRHRAQAHELFAATHGDAEAARMVQRWRIFFMACEELFAFDGGNEWFVTHALLSRKG